VPRALPLGRLTRVIHHMKNLRIELIPLCLVLLLATGCFRVGSETRALRDAALDNGISGASEKIEIGVGMFTVGLARMAAKYVEIPPEAHTILSSLKQAECSVYEFEQRQGSLASILQDADRAMERQDCERLVGVIQENQLVAIYIPKSMKSARNLKASVLVLSDRQLVCATAHADARELIQLAMSKAHEKLPPREKLPASDVASAF
jgi:hypothetical protein